MLTLARAMRLPAAAEIAIVGAGGKTTALFHLARQLAPAIVTTTTHLGEWQTPLADRHVVWSAEVGAADIGDEVGGGVTLVTGSLDEATRRYRAPSRLAIERLRELARARAVAALIEADGARQRPLKAPAAHEPVIPEGVGTVLVVAGLTAVGHALDDTIVHRTEIFTRLSGLRPGDEVTPSALAKVATHPDGGLKGIPPQARPVILLNQADTPALHAVGTEIARSVVPPYQAAVVARLHEPSLVFEVRERVAGIVLAAGASRRFGRPKQVLPYRGRPFVRVVAETALAAGLSPVHVVTGADAARVEEALADLPVLVVRNPEWENGQGTSVRAGTSALPDEVGAAVFLLADQPQVSAAIVRALVDRHASDLPAVVVPTVNGRRANPVLFDRVAFRDLLLLTGDAGGRAVWSRHDLTEVPWSDEALLVDVDTPTDYERLLGER